jgi:hypothetical protein
MIRLATLHSLGFEAVMEICCFQFWASQTGYDHVGKGGRGRREMGGGERA